MELKKSPEANLENKRKLFFVTGLALALALVLVAFEWKQYELSVKDLGDLDVEQEEEELIPITRPEVQPPPPPPPPPQQIELDIVEDEVETEDLDIDSEMDEDTETEIKEIVEEETVVAAPKIFTIVEESAKFPGGTAKMYEFIQKNLKYPQIAKETNTQGTVYLQFVVHETGKISDVKVMRGIGAGCDQEASRVVKAMPNWIPAKQRNQPVAMYFTLPIKFTLR